MTNKAGVMMSSRERFAEAFSDAWVSHLGNSMSSEERDLIVDSFIRTDDVWRNFIFDELDRLSPTTNNTQEEND